jgi:hypothetical protein
MTEDEDSIDDNRDWVELQLKHGDAVLSVGGYNWSDAIAKAALGKMKCRIAAVAGYATEYSSEMKKWGIVFREPVGPIKSRIALALLLAFPERLSRKELVKMVDIKSYRISEYLTNPKKGVKTHVDVNEKSGIVLNTKGYSWAVGILESIEEARFRESKGDDIEQ